MAAAAGQYGEPPPSELQFLRRVDRFGDPYGGGWMNWPAGLIDRVMYLEYVFKTFQAMVGSRNIVDFFNANPQAGSIVGYVTSLRREHGS